MAEFKPGEMDITQHERTFEGFIKMSTRVAIGAIVFIVFIGLVNA